MTYLVSGFNLFKQWPNKSEIIDVFTHIQYSECQLNFKILLIQWSYNLVLLNNKIYLSGLHPSSKMNLFELDLPDEVTTETNNFILSGNDRYIILLDRGSQKIWKSVFERNARLKWDPVTKFWDFGTEEKQNIIESIEISCAMNLCLSTSGLIYDIPLKIDVSQSTGKVCQLRCGNEHAIILTDKGYVYTWGNGRRCQLGHGDLTNCDEPQLVEALAGICVVQVAAGGWHSCALTDCGDLYVWGWNDSGQLGVRSSSNGSPPCKKSKNAQSRQNASIALPILADLFEDEASSSSIECKIVQVSCGSKHTVLALSDNSVWAAGSNKYGQLGAGYDVTQIMHYKKVYSAHAKCNVQCGPWATVIHHD